MAFRSDPAVFVRGPNTERRQMNLKALYRSARLDGAKGEAARQLLAQTHWFTVNASFDPKTGDALPQPLSVYLTKLVEPRQPKKGDITQDRLYRIAEHARPAIERLFRTLNESPRRECTILPVRAVRELDAGSFIKLSTRPGRNIREKLAGKPYLQAVRRFQSVDLPENRLLKACVFRLAELLTLRCDLLGEPEDELLPKIESWLTSDQGRAVGPWENIPPNNTLLSHRDYRRVWDTWRRLQSLDDDIARDLTQLDRRRETMKRWLDYGRMYREATYIFAEMPVLFDYDEFTIRTWTPEPIFHSAPHSLRRSSESPVVNTVVCVDLAEMRPTFASAHETSHHLTANYVWQQWKNATITVDIALFASDAVCLHRDAHTVSSHDLFFHNGNIPDHLLDRAARAFADRLRTTFRTDKLIWLVPDSVNDFELEVVRRNLNAHFPGAEPLPRSIAAMFEHFDYSCITDDGYSVVIVDTIGGIACVTKLIARFDADLQKRLPGTKGYYWERCPPLKLSQRDTEQDLPYAMPTVDSDGVWRQSSPQSRQPQLTDHKVLKDDKRVGHFEFCINVSHSPCAGGLRVYEWQTRAGDIPLWRDRIPELAIKSYVNGYYRRFCLVSRGTTVKPVRGESVLIPIEERFTLPAGRRFYQFPLSQGENAAELRFSARLDSPAFPLKSNTECTLNLTFQYGDDEPYTLTFTPLDRSFPPVRATWERTVGRIITNAPAPSYPSPLSWDDLRRMPKRDSKETQDLLKWAISAVDRLDHDLFIRPRRRTVGLLTTAWRVDKHGGYYAFAECAETNERVFLHQRSFLDGVDYALFQVGAQLSFELQKRDGGYSGWNIAQPDYQETTRLRQYEGDAVDDLIRTIRRRLYFPIIQVWGDGRSIQDRHCPPQFAKAAEKRIAYLAGLIDIEALGQNIKRELLFLLACLHRDAPDACVEWLIEQVNNEDIRDPRAAGFALGDVSQEWQQYIFDRLASSPRNDAVSVFAYAIWREPHFIERFSLSQLKVLLDALSQRLANSAPPRMGSVRKEDQRKRRSWVRKTAEPLELLLGLLRTRDSKDPNIRMLLQPHQQITKQFAEQVDRIEEALAKTQVSLYSRVQINIQKPEGIRTPDLLYALRLYLTGDDGANAIHITGISDTDDD